MGQDGWNWLLCLIVYSKVGIWVLRWTHFLWRTSCKTSMSMFNPALRKRLTRSYKSRGLVRYSNAQNFSAAISSMGLHQATDVLGKVSLYSWWMFRWTGASTSVSLKVMPIFRRGREWNPMDGPTGPLYAILPWHDVAPLEFVKILNWMRCSGNSNRHCWKIQWQTSLKIFVIKSWSRWEGSVTVKSRSSEKNSNKNNFVFLMPYSLAF